jgi:hypothetical protein
MTGFTLLDPILLTAVWTWALWGPTMRTRRTVGLLLLVTLAFVVAALAPPILGISLRAVAVVASLWALLFHTTRFSALPAPHYEFNQAYRGLLNEVSRTVGLRARGRIAEPELGVRLREITWKLQQLDPPDQRWAALKDRTTTYLHAQLARFEQPSAGAADASRTEAEGIKQEYERIIAAVKLPR